tara:strand:+ start:4247 stop:5485 length:1239 start_codon:yes stop_codon:yes gene_type:complete
MHSDDIVISVRDVTKSYRIFGNAGTRLKQAMTFGLKKYYEEYTALKDVSFEVKRGETIGIIGSNGAGKSTLLQLICGILKPSSGTVEVNGRVSAMLELGAGFHPEFTGRENVFFQGSLMGLTETQMKQRFDDIERFAGIGEFIDQSVRTYSSGMFVRLAFAVATHVDPDIIVIDEVLAVGDAVFQQKCIDVVNKLQSSGVSIIVVSHNPYHIERLCHRAAVLHEGKLSELKSAKKVLSSYHELVQGELSQSSDIIASNREGTKEVVFEKVFIETDKASDEDTIQSTESMRIVAEVNAKQSITDVHFRFELYSSANELVTVISTLGLTETTQYHGKHRLTFNMSPCQLTSGWYYITAIAGHKYVRLDTWQRVIDFKVLMKDKYAQDLSMDQGVFISQGQWTFSLQQNDVVYAS